MNQSGSGTEVQGSTEYESPTYSCALLDSGAPQLFPWPEAQGRTVTCSSGQGARRARTWKAHPGTTRESGKTCVCLRIGVGIETPTGSDPSPPPTAAFRNRRHIQP